MNAVTPLQMNADEFLAWATLKSDGRRYELAAGQVVPMSPERTGHIRSKLMICLALRDAIKAIGLEAEAFNDGLSVRIDERTIYEPDALVRVGPRLPNDVVEIDDPVIVVEVVSPSSQSVDSGAKLEGYFRLPSVRHYLIVSSDRRLVIQHGRQNDGHIETRVVQSGQIRLEPPGLLVSVESFFEEMP